jgi:site-specific DNA recombinase
MTQRPEDADGAAQEPLRCAVYARTGADHRTDGGAMSVYEQRDACLRFVRSMPNWQPLPLTYLDVGFSGDDLDRPALQRLMLDIEAGAVDIVVVHDLNRLTRLPLDFCALAHRLKEADVGLVIVADGPSPGELSAAEKEPTPGKAT